jgi:hypothetical protein
MAWRYSSVRFLLDPLISVPGGRFPSGERQASSFATLRAGSRLSRFIPRESPPCTSINYVY